jgi:hypothetical protein
LRNPNHLEPEMTKHTPGPWTVEGRNRTNDGWRLFADSGYGVGVAWDCNGNPENEANARLIAAAPDLLAALKALREEVCGVDQWWGALRAAVDAADDALVKAEAPLPGRRVMGNPGLAARLREAAVWLGDDIPPNTREIGDLDGDVKLDELDLYCVNLMIEAAQALDAA